MQREDIYKTIFNKYYSTYQEDIESRKIDSTDQDLLKSDPGIFFENQYSKLSREIVDFSKTQVSESVKEKKVQKRKVLNFLICFIKIQFVVLVLMILLNGFDFIKFNLANDIITVYMTSVFVETLGIIFFIVKFLFTAGKQIYCIIRIF